jgi:hypothetical protein
MVSYFFGAAPLAPSHSNAAEKRNERMTKPSSWPSRQRFARTKAKREIRITGFVEESQ